MEVNPLFFTLAKQASPAQRNKPFVGLKRLAEVEFRMYDTNIDIKIVF